MLKWIKETLNVYFPKKQNKYVYLDKDKKWLFCYKKKGIIEHKDCDFYEHNLECKKNGDCWGRTHSSHSSAGFRYLGENASILNECKYCLEERRTVKKYRLSDDAVEWLSFCENRREKR